MLMVMIAGRSDHTSLIGTRLRINFGVIYGSEVFYGVFVTMIVAVVSEMLRIASCTFQCAAYTCRCHIRGI